MSFFRYIIYIHKSDRIYAHTISLVLTNCMSFQRRPESFLLSVQVKNYTSAKIINCIGSIKGTSITGSEHLTFSYSSTSPLGQFVKFFEIPSS